MKFTFTLILFFTVYSSFAQLNVSYHNDIEERSFKIIDKEHLNLEERIDFLVGVSPESNELTANYVHQRVKSLIVDLSKLNTKKNLKKFTKKLFQEVHSKLFQQYIENPSFNQIFEEGIYNCATASALYAVLLEELQIPYVIKATTYHVFIIIDPDGEPIMLESTDPVNGLAQINKANYIKMLINMKVISSSDANQYSNEELYKKYVNQDEQSISFKELVGVLYSNSAIKAYEVRDFQTGASLIKKGVLLRPTEINENLRVMGLCALLLEVDYNDTETLYPIIELLKYDIFQAELVNLVSTNFRVHCDNYVRKKYVPATYFPLYNYFMHHLDAKKHEALYDKIKYFHHFAFALASVDSTGNKMATEATLLHFDSTLQYSLEVDKIKSFIAQSIVDLTYHLAGNTEKSIAKLDEYRALYPYIKKHSTLSTYQLSILSQDVTSHYWADEAEPGKVAYLRFMAYWDQVERTEKNQETVGLVYGAISSHYVRQKQDSLAKKWLIDGLKIAPKSNTLKRKMEAFEEYELMYGN